MVVVWCRFCGLSDIIFFYQIIHISLARGHCKLFLPHKFIMMWIYFMNHWPVVGI